MDQSHLTVTRREAIISGAAVLASGAVAHAAGPATTQRGGAVPPQVNTPYRTRAWTAAATGKPYVDQAAMPPGEPGRDYTPVVTPNGVTLPWKVVGGVKVFHLVAEEFDHEFAPGLRARCWGYNGRTPGPTIEVVEGDRVRIYVTNRLPEATSVHWHGVLLPNGMDGVGGLNQPPIPPGETYKYEFTLRQYGTHMYHSHFDEMVQIAMGMVGSFIIHPRNPDPPLPRPDRDFTIMLSEWRVDAGTSRPNPIEMTDFNVFTMNSKSFPATAPLVVKQGDRVRIRLLNLSPMDHHPIHLHGYDMVVTEMDGGPVPPSAWSTQNSVLVAVGQTRAFEFVADEPGDWAMHCHMTHHVMNQMGHASPNTLGVRSGPLDRKVRTLLPGYMTMGSTGMGDMGEMQMPVPPNSIPMVGGDGPFGTIDMGGMLTVLKVRPGITSYEDPGWYRHPPGTVAARASEEELRADGISTAAPATSAPATRSTMPMPAGQESQTHSHR